MKRGLITLMGMATLYLHGATQEEARQVVREYV